MPVQTLLSELPVKTLDVRVLPGTARRDVDGLAPLFLEPVLYRLGHEFRSVVTSYVGWQTSNQPPPWAAFLVIFSMPRLKSIPTAWSYTPPSMRAAADVQHGTYRNELLNVISNH